MAKRNSIKGLFLAVLIGLSVLLAGCGDPGGSCNGTDAIGHITECAYRVVTSK